MARYGSELSAPPTWARLAFSAKAEDGQGTPGMDVLGECGVSMFWTGRPGVSRVSCLCVDIRCFVMGPPCPGTAGDRRWRRRPNGRFAALTSSLREEVSAERKAAMRVSPERSRSGFRAGCGTGPVRYGQRGKLRTGAGTLDGDSVSGAFCRRLEILPCSGAKPASLAQAYGCRWPDTRLA